MGAQQAIDHINRIIRETQERADGTRSSRFTQKVPRGSAEDRLRRDIEARAERILRNQREEYAQIDRAAAVAAARRAAGTSADVAL